MKVRAHFGRLAGIGLAGMMVVADNSCGLIPGWTLIEMGYEATFRHLAASICRLQRTMVQLGHAAGLAAAQCISNHCEVGAVHVAAIQKQLNLQSPSRGVR